MTFAFDSATSVKQIAPCEYMANVQDGWDIMGNANGGYLTAIAARAMLDGAERRDPFTLTTHFLSPVPFGEVSMGVETVKVGKLVTTMTGVMRRGDRQLLRLIGAFGEMGEPHPQLVDTAPPDMASFEECIKRETDDGSFPVGLMKNLTVRMHPDDSMFINGGHSGVALMRGWFEFKDLRPLDTLSLLLATDAMPPPVFNLPIASGWVPTLELTVHVRAVPVGTRLACVFRTRVLQGGLLEEDGELWDEAGNLVALSRQMAVAPRG